MYYDFLENMTNFSLEQSVKIPTRKDNTLDLFLTYQPGKVYDTKSLPSLGSSDHDIVFHEILMPIWPFITAIKKNPALW